MMSMRKFNILSYLGIFLRHSGLEFRSELTLDQDRQSNICPKKRFFKYGATSIIAIYAFWFLTGNDDHY
jgi:hypothetical protein